MDLLKKHYEKIILSVVLLGLAVAAAALPLQVSRVNELLEETRTGVVRTKAKEFKPLDEYLRTNRMVLRRLDGPIEITLSGMHNVFNPVEWKQRPDKTYWKVQTGDELGAGALEIEKIAELRLVITFEPAGEAGGDQQYRVNVLRETDRVPRQNTRVAKAGVRNDLFTILRVEGSAKDPTALLLQLTDEKDQIVVKKEGGYNDVVGYAADLKYPPGKQVFSNKRKGDVIRLEDENYEIVVIDRSNVVLSAKSSQKRTTLSVNATAQVKK